MKTLHVRNIPDNLYRRLRQLARTRNRSLSEVVVEIFSQVMGDEKLHLEQTSVLSSKRMRRFIPPANAPTSLELLHEDRTR